MKLLLEIEDSIIGIATGLIVIGFTERYFKIPYSRTLLIISLIVFFIFLILDIFYTFVNILEHIGWMVLAQVHSLVDIVAVASMLSWLTKINIPVLTEKLVPFFDNPSVVLGVGYFFVIGNLMWLIIYFTDF